MELALALRPTRRLDCGSTSWLKMPPAMLVRARSQMAEATATRMMRAAMLTHAVAADIVVLEGQGAMTRLQRGKRVKRSSSPPFPALPRTMNPGSLMPVMQYLHVQLTALPPLR